MTDELRECPFCGGRNQINRGQVLCLDCKARGPAKYSKAVRLSQSNLGWNTRSVEHQVESQVVLLRDIRLYSLTMELIRQGHAPDSVVRQAERIVGDLESAAERGGR